MKKMFEGYIYVVVNPLITDYVKIGRTKTVAKRVKQLSTGSPMKYKVLHSELVINASQVEAHLHRVFNDVRQNGEWFKTNDIEKIKEEIALIQDKIRCEDEVGFGETIREKYQNACDKAGVGGYTGPDLDEVIKFFSRLDAKKIDSVIQKHVKELSNCYGEMEYV